MEFIKEISNYWPAPLSWLPVEKRVFLIVTKILSGSVQSDPNAPI